jgi:ATP-dependent Clp protease ATP-binding subunit ClpA
MIIIATSNAGADYIYKEHALMNKLEMSLREGNEMTDEAISTKISTSPSALRNDNKSLIDYLIEHHLFSPEFLNRFDGVVTYNPISEKLFLRWHRK